MLNDDSPELDGGPPPPAWLWRAARWGLGLLLLAVLGLAAAVALGVADPQPIGALAWEETWAGERDRWQTFGEEIVMGNGGLEIGVGADEIAGAITQIDSPAYTFEAAGGQAQGPVGAAYGLVVGYQGPRSYLAVLLNGNGYVEVASAGGREWMRWQQWPNILLGFEANRVRVDVQDGMGLIRINDEVLLTAPVSRGAVGVIARGSADGQQVRFGWARYWSK
jgi:hypothetical protein